MYALPRAKDLWLASAALVEHSALAQSLCVMPCWQILELMPRGLGMHQRACRIMETSQACDG